LFWVNTIKLIIGTKLPLPYFIEGLLSFLLCCEKAGKEYTFPGVTFYKGITSGSQRSK
jgi:hypothetical protein